MSVLVYAALVAILIFLCLIGYSSFNRRREQQLEIAAARRKKIFDGQAANVKRLAEEKNILEANAVRLAGFMASAEILPHTIIIQCANGHRYKFDEFEFVDNIHSTTTYQSVSGGTTITGSSIGAVHGSSGLMPVQASHKMNVDTFLQVPTTEIVTDKKIGCPLCRTSLYTHVDPRYDNYKICRGFQSDNAHWNGKRSEPIWFKKSLGSCPLCHPEIEDMVKDSVGIRNSNEKSTAGNPVLHEATNDAFDKPVQPNYNSADDYEDDASKEELFEPAVRWLALQKTVSTASLQNKFKIGYTRAARLIETLEDQGIIGSQDGVKHREVLLQSDQVESYFAGK